MPRTTRASATTTSTTSVCVKRAFSIESEYHLHTRVVSFVRRFYPSALLAAGLGELQDTVSKRVSSKKKGYQKGQPDLTILERRNGYNGMCIEFKSPKGTDRVTPEQSAQLERYGANGYKVLVSNDYDLILFHIVCYLSCLGGESAPT